MQHDECDLNFLFGKRPKEISYMKLKKPKFSGFFFQSLIYILSLIRDFDYLFLRKRHCCDIVIFAETDNQFSSVLPTIKALEEKNIKYILIVRSTVARHFSPVSGSKIPLKFDPTTSILALYKWFQKSICLYRTIKNSNKNIKIDWYFSRFCLSHAYLLAFVKVFQQISPKLILMSNDHNVANRCALFAAKYYNIKTIYIQHASVSSLFPPLEFDYALLDGEKAYQTYRECFFHEEGLTNITTKNAENCEVLLTGQKKQVQVKKESKKLKTKVGIAVNRLDDFSSVQVVSKKFSKAGYEVLIRTHPYQDEIFVTQLKELSARDKSIALCDPELQGVSDFFSSIDMLIAGNTSIHLEASIAGIRTFYLEMSEDVLIPDYYGYVKLGLSCLLEPNFEPKKVVSSLEKSLPARDKVIQKFSSTYGTKWQFHEGVLVRDILEAILQNRSLGELFEERKSDCYKSVGYLK